MKRNLAILALLCIVLAHFMPLTVMAAGKGEPPREPYEKIVAKSGQWHSDHLSSNGKNTLIVGYTGNYEIFSEEQKFEFTLTERTLLTGVYVPYSGEGIGPVRIAIQEKHGSDYQGFFGEEMRTGGLIEVGGRTGTSGANQVNTLYSFTPENRMVLRKGEYILYIGGEEPPTDAFLIKGYNFSAYQRYEKELLEWARAGEEDVPGEEHAEFGHEDLAEHYRLFMEGLDAEEPDWSDAEPPAKLVAPGFASETPFVLDEVLLSVWNDGLGAYPGIITIVDGNNNVIASYQAQGGSQGGIPNTLWVVNPYLSLEAGMYYIKIDTPEVLDYDEDGEPIFYISISAPVTKDPVTDFTGTYRIWLDLYRTSTLMGPVNETTSSFSLEDYELSVLDKGSFIELMGKYENIPFSQNCEVTERDENKVISKMHFAADLTNLPYQARIGATAEFVLEKQVNGRLTINMAGDAFYSRAESKDKGADENTYSLTLRGNRVKKDLSPFVMAALAKAYGAGNIPGPDSPIEVATGVLFPPLVGLIVSVIQGLAQQKREIGRALTIGEQAMRDANRSLGKGLYTEEEARAWATLGDALAGSGGDPQDKISIGDNELPGGADYRPPVDSVRRDEGFGAEYVGADEDAYFAKPDVVDTSEHISRTETLEPEYTQRMPMEPESMVVQTSAMGGQTLIVRDSATGEWVNAESGNLFNLEEHRKNFPKQVKDLEEAMRRNLELEQSGKTAMQIGLDEIENKYINEFNSIQDEINQRWREQLRRDQEWAEFEMQRAQYRSGWGRIAGDSVVGMGKDASILSVAIVKGAKDAGKAIFRGIKSAGTWAGEKLGTAAATLVHDPKQIVDGMVQGAKDAYKASKDFVASIPERTVQGVKNAYNSTKDFLASTKDSVVKTAKEVWEKPWLPVQYVMESGKSAVDFVTDPEKGWKFVKDTVGISDFAASLDPNIPITERAKKVLSGTFKLYTVVSAPGTARAAVSLAGRAAGLAGRTVRVVGRAASRAVGSTKDLVMARARAAVGKGIKPGMPIYRGAQYAKIPGAPDLRGMNKTSQKVLQVITDQHGVSPKVRTISQSRAGYFIETGAACPKRDNLPVKTMSLLDEMLGGAKHGEGYVGLYKPELPPHTVMQTLHPKTRGELVDLYLKRAVEYQQNAPRMRMLQAQGEYRWLSNGLIQDLRQGGKLITSDVDLHDIVSFDGKELTPTVKRAIYKQMRQFSKLPNKPQSVTSAIMHEGTMDWEVVAGSLDEEKKAGLIQGAKEKLVSFYPHAAPQAERMR